MDMAVSPIPGLEPERAAQLLEAFDLTGDMLEAARGADWDAVARLQAQRERVLQAFFATPVPSEAEREVAARLKEIAALNDETVALASEARDSLGAELGMLQTGRRANRAYEDNRG